MRERTYLTAQEAAAELGISPATLYAYVSRGLIHSEPTGEKSRSRRYRHDDVQRLKGRQELRRNPKQVVEKALHWGEPVMDSAITSIADGRLSYRGHNVLSLIASRTVEEVAGFIWLGDFDVDIHAVFEAAGKKGSPQCLALCRQLFGLTPFELLQAALPVAAAEDVAAYDLRLPAVAQTGARILQLQALIATGRERRSATLAQTLQEGWLPDRPEATPLLGTALILCADHELNVSTFTARCAASAGATPYAAVSAGLAALQGRKHGGCIEQVEAFLDEVGTPQMAHTVITHRLKRSERVPGFGHPLYPDGDPRCTALLERLTGTYPQVPALELVHSVATQVQQSIGERPTVDFGLAALARVLKLPTGAALALFAIGRTIGWIGHAIEQYQLDQIIRPRARYTGPEPLLSGM